MSIELTTATTIQKQAICDALLDGVDLSAASIQLADATGLALPAGSLSLNASNQVVVHDEDSNAEDLPYLVSSRNALAFAKRVNFTSGAVQTHLLGTFPMTAAELANNKLVHFIGQIRSLWITALPTTPVMHIVICRDGQNPATDGIRLTIAAPTGSEVISFHLPLKSVVNTGTWGFNDQAELGAGLAQRNTSGTVTHAVCWVFETDYNTISNVSGTDGEPAIIEIYLRTSNASATGSEFLFVSGNIAAISQ